LNTLRQEVRRRSEQKPVATKLPNLEISRNNRRKFTYKPSNEKLPLLTGPLYQQNGKPVYDYNSTIAKPPARKTFYTDISSKLFGSNTRTSSNISSNDSISSPNAGPIVINQISPLLR
ncbi:hypothetical protein SNEBB_005033, partial [Seison nebaliae]